MPSLVFSIYCMHFVLFCKAKKKRKPSCITYSARRKLPGLQDIILPVDTFPLKAVMNHKTIIYSQVLLPTVAHYGYRL